jgi:hypothetical protein
MAAKHAWGVHPTWRGVSAPRPGPCGVAGYYNVIQIVPVAYVGAHVNIKSSRHPNSSILERYIRAL